MLPLLAMIASPSVPAAPTPIDPAGWIRPDDYPKGALHSYTTGAVSYRLDLSKAGAVRDCAVTSSSGDRLLDEATCRSLRARARFTPPTDGHGKSMASFYTGTVRWALPPASMPVISLTTPFPRPPLPIVGGPSGAAFGRRSQPKFGLPSTVVDPIAPPVHVTETETLPTDPAVRTGRLANGLRYMIMHNAIPVGSMSMRMRVAAGPVDETDAQRGYAHLVEHLTFRGTTNVPDGQLVKSLEQMGLALGADTTAHTTPEETIFGLDFPRGRSSPLFAGLFLLREVASRATFAPTAVASERGVVLAEERLRDSPAARADWARLGFLLDGQRMASRIPIGTIGTISNASAAALKAFYDRYYRPDRTTLIVVGDAKLDDMESSIKASFADWAAKDVKPGDQDQGGVQPRAEQVRIVAGAGLPDHAEMNWITPYDGSPDTLARERTVLGEQMAAMILNDRLLRLSQGSSAPFVEAVVHRASLFHSAQATTLSVLAPGRSTTALAIALIEQRRLVRFGVTQAELDRVRTRIGNVFAQGSASSASRPSASLANELLASIVGGTVFTTPAQTQADYAQIVATLTPADLDAAAKRLFNGSGPLVFVTAPQAQPDAERSMRTALAEAQAKPLQALADVPSKPWAYASSGEGSAITDRKDIADLGITIVRFKNGTSVTVKSSPLPKDEIITAANFGAGRAGLPKTLARSFWVLNSAPQVYVNGGLRKATALEIKDQLEGKVVGAQFVTTDERFLVLGRTRRSDFDLQLQLIAAYLTDPAFQHNAWEQARAVVGAATAEIDASASATADRYRALLLHDGDRRWTALPTASDLASSRPEDLPALIKPSLGGPIDLVIVGDIDVDRAIEAARLTIGALPPRSRRRIAEEARFPDVPTDPVLITTHTRPDQAVAIAAWPTKGFYASPADARALQLVAAIIESRLMNGLREQDGLTYSPYVGVDQPLALGSYGALIAQVEINPAKADRFFAALDAIVADLARTSVTSEELDRARIPAIDATRAALATPDYWVRELTLAATDARQIDTIRSRIPDLASVKPADIQRLAQAFLAGKLPFRAIVASATAKRPAGRAAP